MNAVNSLETSHMGNLSGGSNAGVAALSADAKFELAPG
jgi:hypothetical protein